MFLLASVCCATAQAKVEKASDSSLSSYLDRRRQENVPGFHMQTRSTPNLHS